MTVRTVEWVQRIWFPALVFALALLACLDAMGSDVERQIPVVRDAAGSGVTTEISRDGTRQTATPFLTLYNPTLQEIEERIGRIVKITDRPAAKETPPAEITARNAKDFLKGLRSTRKGKPAPAAVVPDPDLRLGKTDASPREAY